MDGFYAYKIKWYDDFDSTIRTNQGVTYASSYTGAMAQLVRQYGEDVIIEVTLYGLAPSDCLELSSTEMAHLK